VSIARRIGSGSDGHDPPRIQPPAARRETRTALLPLPAPADNAAMEADPPKADPPKRKRRWFQFSLRTQFDNSRRRMKSLVGGGLPAKEIKNE
jgi:hypothetical protein